MTPKTKTQLKEENKQQVAAFRKAARELSCDQSEERLQEALRTVAKAKPRPQSTKNEKRD
jgi:hypothetical protein